MNLIGEQITPLKVMTHEKIKTLRDSLIMAKSNGQTVNRASLLTSVEFMITDKLIASEKWSDKWIKFQDDEPVLDDDGNVVYVDHWSTWSDETLFTTLLQMIPEDGVVVSSQTEIHVLMSNRVQDANLENIEDFRNSDLSKFMTKFEDATTKLGDVDGLTHEQTKSIIKLAVQNITKNRDNPVAIKVAKAIRSNLEQNMADMSSFADFRIKLTKEWTIAKSHVEHAQLYGLVHPKNENNKNQNGKRPYESSQSNKEKKSNHTFSSNGTRSASSHSDTDKCTACGRAGHSAADCKLAHFHPSVNKNKHIPFAESEQGKRCLEVFGKSELPFRKDLDGKDVAVPEQYLPKKGTTGNEISHTLNTITTCTNNNTYPIMSCDIILYRSQGKERQKVKLTCPIVLIDSGALDANYIDENYVDELVHMYDIRINENSAKRVTSAVHDNMYKTTKGVVVLELIINNEMNNIMECITCEFNIVKLTNFNMILGIQTIKNTILLKNTDHYFPHIIIMTHGTMLITTAVT